MAHSRSLANDREFTILISHGDQLILARQQRLSLALNRCSPLGTGCSLRSAKLLRYLGGVLITLFAFAYILGWIYSTSRENVYSCVDVDIAVLVNPAGTLLRLVL